MDNVAWERRLREGAETMGLALPSGSESTLVRYVNELLKWNQKVNLTAIKTMEEAVEKHLLDSLAVMPEIAGATTVLDLGTGGGLPGIPLAIVMPQLQVTLVDAVAKKVGFLKSAVATLGLAPRVKAVHLHIAGRPEAEKLPLTDRVVSRAFMDVPEWARMGRPYVAPGGALIAMTGKDPGDLSGLATELGFKRVSSREYPLPWSKAERRVARFDL